MYANNPNNIHMFSSVGWFIIVRPDIVYVILNIIPAIQNAICLNVEFMFLKISDYVMNVCLSFVFVESLKDVAQMNLLTNIVDFFVMLLMCVVSRLITNFLGSKLKRFFVRFLNFKKRLK